MAGKDDHDEFIKWQAETNMKVKALEEAQDCHETRIYKIEEQQTEIRITLGSIITKVAIGGLLGGGLATFTWAMIQHYVLKGK